MKKNIKMYLLTALCAVFMLLALTSCTGESNSNDQITIGIIQMMEHPSLDLIRTSFLEEMEVLGYTDVVFEHRNGVGADMTILTSIAQTFVGNNVDLILAIATLPAQAAAAATSDIPIVFAASSNPVAAGLVDVPVRHGKRLLQAGIHIKHPAEAGVTCLDDLIQFDDLPLLAGVHDLLGAQPSLVQKIREVVCGQDDIHALDKPFARHLFPVDMNIGYFFIPLEHP